MELADEFAFLDATIEHLTTSIRAALLAAPGGGTTAQTLRARFESVLCDIEATVEECATVFGPSSDASDFEKRQTLSLLRGNFPVLEALQSARPWITHEGPSTRVPPGVFSFFGDAADGVLHRPADVLAVASDKYRYAAIQQPLLDQIRDAKKQVARAKQEEYDESAEDPGGVIPFVVSVPLHEAPSLFLHVLGVHELAHVTVRTTNSVETIRKRWPLNHREAQAEISCIADVANSSGSGDGEEDEVREFRAQWVDGRLQRIKRRWVEELLCDAIAFAWIGPAYLLAFASFVLRIEVTGSDTHPSTQDRVRILLRHCRNLGWDDFMEEEFAPVMEWLRAVAARPTESSDEVIALLSRYVRRRSPAIRAVACEVLEDRVWTLAALQSDLAEIRELLRRRILPVYKERGFDSRAIITGGWLWRIAPPDVAADDDDIQPTTDFPIARLVDAVADVETQLFLAKALELSGIASAWNESGGLAEPA